MTQTKQLPIFKAHYIKSNAQKILDILNNGGGFICFSDKQVKHSKKILDSMCECVSKINNYVNEYAEEMKKVRKSK